MAKTKKKTHMKKSAKRMFVFGITSLVVVITISISVLKIVVQIVDKYQEARYLEEKLISLQNKEEKLNSEILKLQDPEYLARYAREKYFYSKNGELIIRIPTE